eukprot:TRINITY_DN4385_c0_g1_i3.p1 TRINITY_DN4385_c0_g1~~TRINITY_DN4385_c0_g1_i3.p1  ORF type:complete len:345 (-),score=30.44 TRINITY_DN4385_c0_g1_i3:85-1119(-)
MCCECIRRCMLMVGLMMAVGGLNFGQQQVLNGTVFSDPESELTCNNMSGSRKRPREEAMLMTTPTHQNQQHLTLLNMQTMGTANPNANANASPSAVALSQGVPLVSTGLQLAAFEETARINQAPTLTAASTTSHTNLMSLLGDDLAAQMQQQQQEIDQLVKLHSEKVRLALEEKRRAHARALLATIEDGIVSRIKSKEAELERVSRKNLELEERVKQLSLEAQIWQNVAKNNEAAANTLKANFEQVLAQNREQQHSREGLGDSVAEDAQSCCNDGDQEDDHSRTLRENRELKEQRICRCCRSTFSSVLLLPCRHFCLCKDCECRVDSCPICKSPKNASVQVYLC